MLSSRATRCLLGGALGDALGYPIEFVSSGAAIVRSFGEKPPAKLLRCSDGQVHVSDDTQMTLFTAEGLTVAHTISAVHAAYQRWLYTQMPDRFDRPDAGGLLDVEAMYARRAPGDTCLSALMENVQSARIPTVETPPNDSKGCGAVMRAAPFGLACATREEAFLLARDAGVLTHGHPSGYLPGAYLASLVFDLARGAPLEGAVESADALLVNQRGYEETAAALARTHSMTRPTFVEIESLPNGGWVGEWALAIALACVQGATDPADALWRAAAHGGDSDSTASIAGNLLGAMGAAFPPAWLDELEMRDVIEGVALRLVNQAAA